MDTSPNPPIPRCDRRHRKTEVPKTCKMCDGKHYARGFCRKCYFRWYASGSPLGKRQIKQQRLEKLPQAPPVASHKKWTTEEIETVLQLRREKNTINEISRIIGRSSDSISAMLYRRSLAWINGEI